MEENEPPWVRYGAANARRQSQQMAPRVRDKQDQSCGGRWFNLEKSVGRRLCWRRVRVCEFEFEIAFELKTTPKAESKAHCAKIKPPLGPMARTNGGLFAERDMSLWSAIVASRCLRSHTADRYLAAEQMAAHPNRARLIQFPLWRRWKPQRISRAAPAQVGRPCLGARGAQCKHGYASRLAWFWFSGPLVFSKPEPGAPVKNPSQVSRLAFPIAIPTLVCRA